MVNRLSDLAEFLEDESLPLWLKRELEAKQEAISRDLAKGEPVTLTSPSGENVTIKPTTKAAA